MEGQEDGKGGLCSGCNSISQKIFARASSSESLEGGPVVRKHAWKRAGPATGSLKKRLLTLNPTALANKFKSSSDGKPSKAGLGTMSGVLIPTCENMWGVLIFLRFYYIVGNAGVWQSFLVVFLSFLCAILTTMSLSAVATNGPIEEGGTYFLISRALGPKLGGTVGIMYYLGVSLLAVLESLGAVEMLLFTFKGLEFTSANRVISAMILSILCFLVYFGISFVSKLSLVFFLVVIYTMCSYYLGLFTAPRGHAPENLTGLKWSTFKGNWNSGYDPGVSFPVALAIFFPCYTGILSGADRAKNLAYPEKSIPRGTIGAVTISLVMYLSYMGLWSAVGPRDYLLGRAADGTKRGSSQNLEVVKDVAFPLAILTQLGIIIASMAQAFQCLITSPRLLQAIASDGVIPPLRRFSKTSKTGEPRAALLFTTILCVLAAMIGSLDAVAPLVSICFLTAYAALNFSCFVLSLLKAPSWRPKWKFYHWSAALLGFCLCFAVNFVIKYYWAIVAVVVQVFIYIYIDYRQVEVDWGTGLGGLRLQLAVQSILSVGHEARYSVNWRPQLLCLCKPRSVMALDDHNNQEFMLFVSQLKKGRGLCVVATILEGTLEKMAPQVEAERLELENTMQTASVTGFARVLVAPSYKEGKTYAIQSSGLGALEPNTLVLGWPNKWYEEGHYHSAKVMLEILDECKAVDKAVVLCMNLELFPTEGTQQEGYIDVWWIVHDGGLLLILAHLLKQHRIWRKCKLRVHTVSEQIHDPVLVKRNLKRLLDRIRIDAEVQVIDMDTGGLAPYTYDTTIRIEEARAFAEEVAQYRLAQEQQKWPELSKQTSSKLLRNVSLDPQAAGKLSRKESLDPQAAGKLFRKDSLDVQASGKLIRKQSHDIPAEFLESSKSPTPKTSNLGDRPTLEDIFKNKPSGDRSPHNVPPHTGSVTTPVEQADDEAENSPINNQSNTVDSDRFNWYYGSGHEQQENPALDRQEFTKSGRHVEQPFAPTLTKSQSGHTVDYILKKTVPAELSMLEGVTRQPRPRSGPLHALKSGGSLPKDSVNKEWDLPSPTTSRDAKENKEGGILRQGKQDLGPGDPFLARLCSSGATSMQRIEEGNSPTHAQGRSSPLRKSDLPNTLKNVNVKQPISGKSDADSVSSTSAAESNQQKSAKETRWADNFAQELDKSSIPEIIVEGTKEDEEEKSEEGSRRGMVRTGSAGQLYPGSPHNSDYGGPVGDLPEVVNRTWETFSQNYSPSKLNEIIMEQSKDAQLVVLNLPDHYQGMEPARYMEYCEDVTRGLRRVLLVHGTGKEMWNAEQL